MPSVETLVKPFENSTGRLPNIKEAQSFLASLPLHTPDGNQSQRFFSFSKGTDGKLPEVFDKTLKSLEAIGIKDPSVPFNNPRSSLARIIIPAKDVHILEQAISASQKRNTTEMGVRGPAPAA